MSNKRDNRAKTINEEHDEQMEDVYAHIYTDFYDLTPESLNASKNTIQKNLSEIGIQLKDLPKLNAFNIGPAREAAALHQLGFKNVFHADISNLAVDTLKALSKSKPEFANLHSQRQDICNDEPLIINDKIDFVYLSGVLHHLHSPGKALNKLYSLLSPDAKLFFRIYRSGSLAFFVVDFIRRFISFADIESVKKVFDSKFSQLNENDRTALYSDMYDDFFVPVLNLFDPREADKYFIEQGFQLVVNQEFKTYNHSDGSGSGQGWSLYYKLAKLTASHTTSFPKHTDQLDGIKYSENYIQETIGLMKRFLEQQSQISTETKISCALDLYKASQIYRYGKEIDAEKKHRELQELIKQAI